MTPEDIEAERAGGIPDAALQQRLAQLELILQAAGEGIVGLDGAGTITYANPAAATMTGYTPEELPGHALL